jgi:hypothetical protein
MLLVAGLLLQPAPAKAPAPTRVPNECPRFMLTWHPGMPLPTTPPAENAPSVVVAMWDSGVVLRSESIDRPYGAHVIGTVAASERDALLQSVSASAIWSRPSTVYPDAPSLALAWNRGSDVQRYAQSPAPPATTELETLRARVFALKLRRVQTLAAPIAIDRWRCPPASAERR